MEIHSPNTDGPFLNYAKTQRVVLLIDLNPLISLQKPPDRFLSSLLCSAKSILSFLQLSSSLFAFRFFFSSLSPLFSSSKIQTLLPNSSISLSFDRPIPALESLARALESLASRIHGGDGSSENHYPSGSYVAAAMRQLVHDYAWDPLIDESTTGTPLNFDSVAVRSNLILLFSPVPSELKSLAKWLSVGIEDQCLANVCAFREKFRGLFANVNDAFSSRDIQLSWIDVRSETAVELESDFECFMSGVKNLGWGFCSTDSIVLGSALFPFGLIYPKIGISPNSFSCDDCSKKVQAQLSLEIVDVSKKPLECKCCNLELVDMKLHRRNGSCDSNVSVAEVANSRKIGIELKKKLFACFGDGINKYKVKALHKNSEFRKFKCNLSDPILVREVSLKPGKDHKKSCDGFFADKVLEMLTGSAPRKSSAPIWQILLTFLYKEGYCATTTISNSNGNSLTGILKPFTVSTALLFLTDADLANFSIKVGEVSISAERSEKEGRKSMDKKNSKFLQDQSWDGFCAAAFESSEQELEEIYFSKRCSDQKRLRFLKCWMKQTKKSGFGSTVLEEKSEPSQQEIQEDVKERLIESNQENEKPTSSASAGEYSSSAASRIQEAKACRAQDSEAVDLQLESPEFFFGNLSNKIQQGLESEAVDLGALAQRLVNSSIYWLNRKQEKRNSESQMLVPKSQDSTGDSRGAELVRLLLRDPKDLTAKGKRSDVPSQESSPEKIVRGYELQILFRMEILQSEIGGSIGEPMKQKFVKQICLLLETVQCHLEGGFFGDWSVDKYVGKIIKARYSLTLDGIVNKIYKKMDLLLFAEEEELPVNIFNNSEDSNPPLREKPDRDELDEFRSSERVSAEESLQSLESGDSANGEHARKLTEAKARRERARRFTSFTSWVPDLQRVWAPKQQPKPTKSKSEPHGKRPKKKKRAEETVCETPMSKNRRSHRYDSDDQQFGDDYDKSSRSVSKALFQDDW